MCGARVAVPHGHSRGSGRTSSEQIGIRCLLVVLSLAVMLIVPAPVLIAQESGTGTASLDVAPPTWGNEDWAPFITRFSLSHIAGENVGIDQNYTTLEWFMPLCGDTEWDLVFGDARGIFRNDGTVGTNLGLGWRQYDPETNRIIGINGYWDFRETEHNGFNQLGWGLESLGRFVDLRMNMYIPATADESQLIPNRFEGNRMLTDRRENAMLGIEGEIGLSLPPIGDLQACVFGGLYQFTNWRVGTASGWRLRGELMYTEALALETSVQRDELFGTTWTIGGSLRYVTPLLPPHLQGKKPMEHMFYRCREADCARHVYHRLGDPVPRLRNIVLSVTEELATTSTGVPLTFLHVQDGSAGDGTYESPYGQLNDALADPRVGNAYVYARGNGIYDENVTLGTGYQVYSNGPVQSVPTQFGDQRLPHSGANLQLTGLPEIRGRVRMADAATLSGFNVTDGIVADGVDGFTLRSNAATRSSIGPPVIIRNVNGATIDQLLISEADGIGLAVLDSSLDISGLTVTNTGGHAVEIVAASGDSVVNLSDVTIDDVQGRGIDARLLQAGNLSLTLSGTNTISTQDTALHVANGLVSTGRMVLSVNGLTAQSSGDAGVVLHGTSLMGGLFYLAELDNVNVTQAARGGFLANGVIFDSDPTTPALEPLMSTSITIGNPDETTLVTGDGFALRGPTGIYIVETLTVGNDSGTGLLVRTENWGTLFQITTGPSSVITTTNGTAIDIEALPIDLSFFSVQSAGSPASGIQLDGATGFLRIANTTITNSQLPPIVASNTPAPLSLDLGDLKIITPGSRKLVENLQLWSNNSGNVSFDFLRALIDNP